MASRNKAVAVLFACALSTAVARAQTTYFVDGSCGDDAWTGSNPVCASPSGPKRTIQAGIDASVTGDNVIVADGTYTGTGNRDLDFGGRDIHLRSESLDPALCIINCQGSQANPHRGFIFQSGETLAAVVEGFTITRGYMTGPTQADNKGGAFYIEASAATIRHCVFTDNTVDLLLFSLTGGGALGAVEAILDISDCVFSRNRAISSGTPRVGALLAVSSTLTFTRCTMTNNTAGSYGAVRIHGVSTWIDCIIADNSARNAGGAYGGLALFDPGPHVLRGCEITGNQADNVGGGLAENSTLEDCLIANNSARRLRGGFSGTVIRNSIIRDNHAAKGWGGGAFYLVENCVITGNTTSVNGVGGVFAGTISGCLIMGNSSGGGPYGQWTAGGVTAARVIDCIVIGNTSTVAGGGIHATIEVVNCLVLGNSAPRAAGILAQEGEDTRIVNCTVVGNTASVAGGGVASLGTDQARGNTATVSNSIVWGNSAPVGAQLAALDLNTCCSTHPSELTVAYTDAEGGQAAAHADPLSTLNWLAGNIDADPLFVDPGNDDYHISPDSPVIDAGDNTAVPAGVTTDLDGNPRFVDDPATPDTGVPGGAGGSAIVDMGAYEFGSRILGDLNCDGAFNGADIDPFFLALGDPAAYAAQFPNCDILNGDMNRDGRLDGADIDPFFACLGAGGCP